MELELSEVLGCLRDVRESNADCLAALRIGVYGVESRVRDCEAELERARDRLRERFLKPGTASVPDRARDAVANGIHVAGLWGLLEKFARRLPDTRESPLDHDKRDRLHSAEREAFDFFVRHWNEPDEFTVILRAELRGLEVALRDTQAMLEQHR